jgi:histidinol-phosphate aminotransferase
MTNESGKSIRRPIHGSITPAELRELGVDIDDVIDFSSNINPLGVSPRVRAAMSAADASRYPDPDCLELREALARRTNVSIENIIVGNGSTELIHLIVRAFAADGPIVIATPTYGEYEFACRLAGNEPVFIRSLEETEFNHDIATLLRRIEKTKPSLVFLCNPNNPTGVYLKRGDVERIAATAKPGLLVLDEAYLPFVARPWNSNALIKSGNVVILHSMTKDHALAGVRLGYALASEAIVAKLKHLQPFWSVNAIAQAMGLAALEDNDHVRKGREEVFTAKTYLEKELERLDLAAIPSSANFILVKVGDAPSMRRQLLRRGLCVRDCTSFGLPRYIRISIRTQAECKRLAEGLKAVVGGTKR